ncbi:hypothetical protein X777_08887, partial [Ooceraea biroi]
KSDVILFHLLPSLCCKRTRGASVSVPSVAEARKTFILHVLIPGDLNREIKTPKKYSSSVSATNIALYAIWRSNEVCRYGSTSATKTLTSMQAR